MSRRIVPDILPATATHCETTRGRCKMYDPGWQVCNAFDQEPEWDSDTGFRKRLPACRAAEVKT